VGKNKQNWEWFQRLKASSNIILYKPANPMHTQVIIEETTISLAPIPSTQTHGNTNTSQATQPAPSKQDVGMLLFYSSLFLFFSFLPFFLFFSLKVIFCLSIVVLPWLLILCLANAVVNFCGNCGQRAAGGNFCPGCGTKY
jgi:hypothetical protein